MAPDFLIQLLLSTALMFIGLVLGRISQARHYLSIRARERTLRDILVFNERTPPPGLASGTVSSLVTGSVVLSDDAFTAAYAALRSALGGRIRVYETLLDRARREALLRLKTQARELGANLVFNIRFETTDIASNGGGSSLGGMEVFSYGTAIVAPKTAHETYANPVLPSTDASLGRQVLDFLIDFGFAFILLVVLAYATQELFLRFAPGALR